MSWNLADVFVTCSVCVCVCVGGGGWGGGSETDRQRWGKKSPVAPCYQVRWYGVHLPSQVVHRPPFGLGACWGRIVVGVCRNDNRLCGPTPALNNTCNRRPAVRMNDIIKQADGEVGGGGELWLFSESRPVDTHQWFVTGPAASSSLIFSFWGKLEIVSERHSHWNKQLSLVFFMYCAFQCSSRCVQNHYNRPTLVTRRRKKKVLHIQ